MLKGNSFQLVKLLMYSFSVGVHGDINDYFYQSAVSIMSQQKEGTIFIPLWHTNFPDQFIYTQPQKCRTLVAGGK